MSVRARVSLLLKVNDEEFHMPVDGDPTEELEEMLFDVLEHLEGTQVLKLNIKCTGGRIDD